MSWIGDIPFEELGMNQERLDLLEELSEDNDYWKAASSFLQQVKDSKFSSLSDLQRNWVYEIIATLGVELNRKIARFVFYDS